jgi:ABC-type sugar transport system ATPase subunit
VSKTPILETRKIKKRFPGTMALDDVSLQFFAGEVHTLMGENGAGKSTLLNVLTGSLPPSGGEIFLRGKAVSFRSPVEARNQGISIVHQELSLFPEVSVLENLLVSGMPSRHGFMDKRKMQEISRRYFAKFSPDFSADDLVQNLSVSQRQIAELVKALVIEADVYIFDEPTATLSGRDVDKLFQVIRELKEKGKAIVYVSHKFDEIFQISDRISVLRDGQLIGTELADKLDSASVIRMMVGRSLERIYPEKRAAINGIGADKKLLSVKNLNAGEKCKDVSFNLFQGEILGVFGLVGSGRTEIVRALTAIDPRQSGEIELEGKKTVIKSVQSAIENGIYYLTEDRKQQGLFLKMSVTDNIAVTHLERTAKAGMVNNKENAGITSKAIANLRVKASSITQLVGSLSGGNQQKVMIGKWLSLHPKVVILDEPTRGIDVGAKAEIHQLLRSLANDGIGVIVISSELPEIVGLSDRVLVVHKGSIAGSLSGQEINDEVIMSYASGLLNQREGGVSHV